MSRIQSASAHSTTKLQCFSDDSSERIWLASAFITHRKRVWLVIRHSTVKRRNDRTNKPNNYVIVKGISHRQYIWLSSVHDTIFYSIDSIDTTLVRTKKNFISPPDLFLFQRWKSYRFGIKLGWQFSFLAELSPWNATNTFKKVTLFVIHALASSLALS